MYVNLHHVFTVCYTSNEYTQKGYVPVCKQAYIALSKAFIQRLKPEIRCLSRYIGFRLTGHLCVSGVTCED